MNDFIVELVSQSPFSNYHIFPENGDTSSVLKPQPLTILEVPYNNNSGNCSFLMSTIANITNYFSDNKINAIPLDLA